VDALPLRQLVPVSSLVKASGLATAQVLGVLGRLERSGLAVSAAGGWRKARP
jgi:predicted Rossmann fold nucleotide-binding protein DprA/Smf involved in DNA uptake